jgi:hypothetical protein
LAFLDCFLFFLSGIRDRNANTSTPAIEKEEKDRKRKMILPPMAQGCKEEREMNESAIF